MIGFLRWLGVLNAAVWFGSAFAFTFVAAPAVFSADTENLLGPKYYHYLAGKIAGFIIHRAFNLQLICGTLALLHLLLERIYFGKPPGGLRLGLLIGLLVLTLFGGFIAEPKIQSLHETRYSPKATQAERNSARETFSTWHGVAQGVNVLVLLGLAIYTGRVGQRPE
jgi:hypothetical protein